MMDGKDLHKVLISKEMWNLQYTDIDQFKADVTEYLKNGYPGYMPVKTSKGFIICIVERR